MNEILPPRFTEIYPPTHTRLSHLLQYLRVVFPVVYLRVVVPAAYLRVIVPVGHLPVCVS